ncbi:MAG: hypothetical protein J6Y38_01675, partial [Bacteroidaceae bacterium]|nr:hypothetical protein [Bacteroidaceae bacterium]
MLKLLNQWKKKRIVQVSHVDEPHHPHFFLFVTISVLIVRSLSNDGYEVIWLFGYFSFSELGKVKGFCSFRLY